jgi:hypothetical protein
VDHGTDRIRIAGPNYDPDDNPSHFMIGGLAVVRARRSGVASGMPSSDWSSSDPAESAPLDRVPGLLHLLGGLLIGVVAESAYEIGQIRGRLLEVALAFLQDADPPLAL